MILLSCSKNSVLSAPITSNPPTPNMKYHQIKAGVVEFGMAGPDLDCFITRKGHSYLKKAI